MFHRMRKVPIYTCAVTPEARPLSAQEQFASANAQGSMRLPRRSLSMDQPYRAEVMTSWPLMAARWLRMEESAFGTPFQHAHWLKTWYGVFAARNVEPVLVAVADRNTGEDVLLIPLVRHSAGALRTIEFADQWATDYNAPLIGNGAPHSQQGAEALWNTVLAALPPADRI